MAIGEVVDEVGFGDGCVDGRGVLGAFVGSGVLGVLVACSAAGVG